MIIECEKCKARYRVAENALKKAETTVRCSRCQHVFAVALRSTRPSSAEEKDFMKMFGGQERTYDASHLEKAVGSK